MKEHTQVHIQRHCMHQKNRARQIHRNTHILFLEAIKAKKKRHTHTHTHTHIPSQSWWKQKQSALRVQRSKLLLRWSGNSDHSRLSFSTPTFLCHLTERKWGYKMIFWIWCVTILSSLTAWSVVVCCKVDAVFWTPACEKKKQWRKEPGERKDLIVLTFFNMWKLSEFRRKSAFGICRDHRLWLWFLLSAVWARRTSTPGLHSKTSLVLFNAKGDGGFHTAKILLVQGLWAE